MRLRRMGQIWSQLSQITIGSVDRIGGLYVLHAILVPLFIGFFLSHLISFSSLFSQLDNQQVEESSD